MPDEYDYDMQRATQGTTGQMKQDLVGVSDEAKRIAETRQPAVDANAARNLKIATTPSREQMQALEDMAADKVMATLHAQEMNPNDRRAYIGRLSTRITEMQRTADDIMKPKTGTGNVPAYNTYMRVIAVLKKRLHGLQSEDVGVDRSMAELASADAGATAQPAGGQQ
jgi:hypothetical protein